MGGIFISYRREDSGPYAGRLRDALSGHFGAEQVFRDIDTINPGERFLRIVEREVSSCDALLAVIGPMWLTIRDTRGRRRLENPEDYVRLEIAAALARLVSEERRSLHQRVEPELLREFGRRLDDGGADAVLSALRGQFDEAAATLGAALTAVGIPDDASAFIESASAEELAAWQSVRPAVAALDTVAAIARQFGPLGSFPTVVDPRTVDPAIRCGWLHDISTMCTDGDVPASCAEFQKPHPLGDVRSSPWLRVSPHLHTIASARERLRAWAESAWAAEESQRPVGGRLIDGQIIDDAPRANPFTLAEAKAS